MGIATEWLNRLRHRSGGAGFEETLDDEIRFHLETRVADLEASGISHRDALAQARREFGSMALVREESRAAWQFRWFEDLIADLRYSLRGFLRSPAFTIAAVLSLSLGIGGTSAIYTALDTVFWQPLPVEDPGRLVGFQMVRQNREPMSSLPGGLIGPLRTAGVFAGLTISSSDGLSFSYDGRAERIIGDAVSPDYFATVGVKPLLGETFTAGVRAGRWAPEAVLSHAFWKRRFGGDPSVIGKTIHLNTYPFTIVGVTPPSFSGIARGVAYELRIPMLPEGREIGEVRLIRSAPGSWTDAVARLRPGASIAQAEISANVVFQDFLRTTSVARFRNAGLSGLRLIPLPAGDDSVVRQFRTPLYVLLALVGLVLWIACANVASMLLARAAARAREVAIRTSIGAGRFRLIRQMLAESVLLSCLGGALGLVIAYWAGNVLFGFLPQGHISLTVDLHPGPRTLLFTFGLSMITGLLFGLAPAFQSTHGGLAAILKDGAAGVLGRGGSARLRKILVAAQVGFSMLLLLAAGVFVRTASQLRPPGYRTPERILLFTLKPQQEIYSSERKTALAAELHRRISALPGVVSSALAENGPLGSRRSQGDVLAAGDRKTQAGLDMVTPGFFETLGIARVAGRDFTPADLPGSPRVAIVNQALARDLFAGEDPLGRTVTLPGGPAPTVCTIVGVTEDVRYFDPHKAPQPMLWLAIAQTGPYMPTLHVRTGNPDTASMIAAVRREFDQIDKGFPVFNIRTMAARIEDSLANERMIASLSGAFGLLALLLAAVGLYGILAYSVSRRMREIGIRMALGARASSVLWTIAREAIALVAAGSAGGLALALIAKRFWSEYLVGVAPIEPSMVAACFGGMVLVATAAIAIPAMRGCRVDPLRALRQE